MSKFPSDIKAASKFLNDRRFEYYGKIIEGNPSEEKKCACFEKGEIFDDDRQGFVYFWIKFIKDTVELVYIGCTGKKMSERCGTQENGFCKGEENSAGYRHNKNIIESLDAGAKFIVYARKSNDIELWGVDVSMYKVEELALIKKFNPLWNKQK